MKRSKNNFLVFQYLQYTVQYSVHCIVNVVFLQTFLKYCQNNFRDTFLKSYLLIVDDKDAKWSIFEYSTIKNFLPVTHLRIIVDFLKEGLEGFYNFFYLK